MAVTITRTAWTDDDGSGTTGTVINNAVKTELYGQIDTALALLLPLAGGTISGTLAVTGAATLSSTLTVAGLITAGSLAAGTQAVPKNGIIAWCDPNSKIALTLGASSNLAGGVFAYFRNASEAVQGSISATNSTTTAYTTMSDKRMKTDKGIVTSTDVIRLTQVHDFVWKPNGIAARGVFAQDVIDVLPEAVTIGTDDLSADGLPTTPWSVDYSKFVPDLIVGWQSHNARIAAIEARIGITPGQR